MKITYGQDLSGSGSHICIVSGCPPPFSGILLRCAFSLSPPKMMNFCLRPTMATAVFCWKIELVKQCKIFHLRSGPVCCCRLAASPSMPTARAWQSCRGLRLSKRPCASPGRFVHSANVRQLRPRTRRWPCPTVRPWERVVRDPKIQSLFSYLNNKITS